MYYLLITGRPSDSFYDQLMGDLTIGKKYPIKVADDGEDYIVDDAGDILFAWYDYRDLINLGCAEKVYGDE